MAQQQLAKLSWAPLNDVDAATIDEAEVLSPVLNGEAAYARAFQQRLVEAYSPVDGEQKLPGSQRLAVILSLTCTLWIMAGIAIVAILYAWPQPS